MTEYLTRQEFFWYMLFFAAVLFGGYWGGYWGSLLRSKIKKKKDD